MPNNESSEAAPHAESSSGDSKHSVSNSPPGNTDAGKPTAARRKSTLAILTVLCALVAALSWLAQVPTGALVVYCSHDSIYSDEILREFQSQTGIELVIRYDTEATKSLGLVNLLIAEKDDPICDVFWNNEVLGTMKLKREGVLQKYSRAESSRIPSRFRDPDGLWIGFAARMRVWIVNTDNPTFKNGRDIDWLARLNDEAQLGEMDLTRVAMAKPLYGSTLTHYSVLTNFWGLEKLRRWHHDSRDKGLLEVNGNAAVKDLVANGKADFGWTDTDDFFLAVSSNEPVTHAPVLVGGKPICIPNSVAIIHGTKKLSDAERLVEFLTSEEVEVRLANSSSRQIPLGEVHDESLPDLVRQWKVQANDAIDLSALGDAHQECLDWLRSEYSR